MLQTEEKNGDDLYDGKQVENEKAIENSNAFLLVFIEEAIEKTKYL